MKLVRVTFLLAVLAGPVFADEQETPLAAEGNWVATSHSDSETDPPDVCLAFSTDGLVFRTDDSGNIDVRFVNEKWSLPASVNGTLELVVGKNSFPLQITGNTQVMVDAPVTQDQLTSIIANMNKVATMVVKAGSAPPQTISLAGSNTVVAAFLTCANISPPAGDAPAGANPFAGSAPPPSGQ